MRVAAVFYDLAPEGGGAFAFGRSLYDALRAAEGDSPHELLYYSVGRVPEDEAVIRIPHTLPARSARRAIELVRDVQDRMSAPRVGPRTWFERSLDAHGVDLVFFATNYAEPCDQPFIFTILDIQHVLQPWFPEVSARGEWERRHHYFTRYLRKATRVIVPNEAGAEQLLRHFPIEPDRVTALGHPTPAFALEAARRAPASTEVLDRHGVPRPYLFYPAQFWAHKNHVTLLTALAELNETAEPRYGLVCSGSDKGQLEHVRALARELGVAGDVRFPGFVTVPELVALYQSAEALVYLSMFGPENLPPLEAFALGCPVVYSDVPGARDQLGDAALLVPPTDPSAVVEAVRRVGDPAVRERLVEAGRRRAAQSSAEAYVSGVLAFVDDFARIRRGWR